MAENSFHSCKVARCVTFYPYEETASGIVEIIKRELLLSPINRDRLALVHHFVHHISNDSAGRRELSCSASVEHGVTQHISMNENRIENAVHAVERIVRSQKERRHHGKIVPLQLATVGQKFDRHTQSFRVTDIGCGDLRDTLGVDILVIHLLIKSQGGKDSDLPAGIITFHIRLRIALRITQSLSLLQHIVKIGTLLNHFRQDVICGSVQDSCDLVDLIGGQ